MIGIPEPRASLLDRVRASRPPAVQGDITDAGRQIDTGGMSAAGFGPSPYAGHATATAGASYPSRIYDGYAPAVGGAANGTSMAPARLVQRINPQSTRRGGVRKEYEGGGP